MALVKRKYMYELVARQLQDDGHKQAGLEVARLGGVTIQPNLTPSRLFDLLELSRLPRSTADFSGEYMDLAASDGNDKLLPALPISKDFPRYATRFVTAHKLPCRVAKFSQDGQLVATGSTDASIKLLSVAKMHFAAQVKGEKVEDYTSTKPVVRTFYDHSEPICDLDFHPIEPFLVSCGKDCTIKFFDHSKNTKRSYRSITDSMPIRSINFHPTGDFLLSAGDHHLIRLYDMTTFQAYISNDRSSHHTAPINQVRYAAQGNVYVSAGRDGCVKIWDAVTNRCVNTIARAHGGAEVSSVQFSPSGKYLLSGGHDSSARLWELSTGKQVMSYQGGHQQTKRMQTVFTQGGDFVLSSDEQHNTVVAWDTRTGELVSTLSGHNKVVRWLAASPCEQAFVSCGEDNRARFWSVDL